MSDRKPTLSKCPHCGARGVLINDPLSLDGSIIDDPYCGVCGRNWPLATFRRVVASGVVDGQARPIGQ